MLREENSQSQTQASTFDGSISVGRMEFTHNGASNFETIFSPVLQPFELHDELDFKIDPGTTTHPNMSIWGADESDNKRIFYDDQTCNVSDLFINDVLIASLPFNESGLDNVFAEINPLPDYIFPEPNMLFDVAEQYMMLPFLEDKSINIDVVKSGAGNMIALDKSDLYFSIDQMSTQNVGSVVRSVSDQAKDFDPQLFVKNKPELSDVVAKFLPNALPKKSKRMKYVTLVLDLDETLVYSTLEQCDDADFTFTVFFNMKEHTVYVKQRPRLHRFLEKVAEMFRVVVFTASQSIYASHLLDILDPDGKFVCQRFYRESCILSDGIYTKDLTVLGLDLAKVAIIDNCPQLFRFQVNNGIPIESWYDDPSDDALISLLPFLETLVDAEDVRPIIAKRFDTLTYITRLSAKGRN